MRIVLVVNDFDQNNPSKASNKFIGISWQLIFFIDDAASLLCAAAGFVKNAAELQLWNGGEEFILVYKQILLVFLSMLLWFDFSGFEFDHEWIVLPVISFVVILNSSIYWFFYISHIKLDIGYILVLSIPSY